MVCSHIVSVISDDRMDDPQELSCHGHQRLQSQHASVRESCIIVIHDPVLSDHLDSSIVEDLPE